MNHRCTDILGYEWHRGVLETFCSHGWRWTTHPPPPAPGSLAYLSQPHRGGRPALYDVDDLPTVPKVAGCRHCAKCQLGACSNHGGPSKEVRDSIYGRRWRAREKQAEEAQARRKLVGA